MKKDNILLRWKKRLSSVHMYSITLVILAIIMSIGIYQYKDKLNYKNYLQNTFEQSFYESVKYVDDVDNLMAKINLTNKPNQRIPIFSDLYKKAASAQENMGRLPYSQSVINSVLKFLSQMSDFSYAMLLKSADGEDFTKKEIEQMNSLADYSNKLSQKLMAIKKKIRDGNVINWDKIQKEGDKYIKKAEDESSKDEKQLNDSENKGSKITGSLIDVRKDFQDYPTLIYDGPFSDHIEKMEPEFLKNKNKVDKDTAKKIAEKFIGKENIESIELTYESKHKVKYTIGVYRFRAKLKNSDEPSCSIDITKQGGKVLWMLNYTQLKDKDKNKKKLNIKQVKEKAEEFLEKAGYKNMEENYYENVGDSIVLNYAYVQDKVTIYPDLIKVKVSIYDGNIVGFESLGYIMMHKQREISQVKIDKIRAREEIASKFNVERVKLALIPLESKKETLTWEFKGKYNEKEFLVYINAENGKQEKIMQVLRNKSGVFVQ